MGPMMMGEPSNGLAIGALVVGILAIPGACCCYSSIPLGIAAIIMGVIAMNKAKESPHTHGGKGLALGGLVCGIIGLVMTLAVFALGMGMSMMERFQH
jgi:uncharacterized membrane protein HdeD (DUF308 family)